MLWSGVSGSRHAFWLVAAFWFGFLYSADAVIQALFKPLHVRIAQANRALQKESAHSKIACEPITVLKRYEQSFEADVDEILHRLADKQNDRLQSTLQSLIHSEQVDDLVRGVDNRLFVFYVACYKKKQTIAQKGGLAERVRRGSLLVGDVCPEGARLCRSFWALRGSVVHFQKYIELNDYRMMHMALCLWCDVVAMRAFGDHFGISSPLPDAQHCLPNDVLGCISEYLLPRSIPSRSGLATLWRELQERKSESPNLLDMYKDRFGKAANRDIVALFYALGFRSNQTVSR